MGNCESSKKSKIINYYAWLGDGEGMLVKMEIYRVTVKILIFGFCWIIKQVTYLGISGFIPRNAFVNVDYQSDNSIFY